MITDQMEANENNNNYHNQLYVPLNFWFTQNPGLALPTIALQYHEVNIDLYFNLREKQVMKAIIDKLSNLLAKNLSEIKCKLVNDLIREDLKELLTKEFNSHFSDSFSNRRIEECDIVNMIKHLVNTNMKFYEDTDEYTYKNSLVDQMIREELFGQYMIEFYPEYYISKPTPGTVTT